MRSFRSATSYFRQLSGSQQQPGSSGVAPHHNIFSGQQEWALQQETTHHAVKPPRPYFRMIGTRDWWLPTWWHDHRHQKPQHPTCQRKAKRKKKTGRMCHGTIPSVCLSLCYSQLSCKQFDVKIITSKKQEMRTNRFQDALRCLSCLSCRDLSWEWDWQHINDGCEDHKLLPAASEVPGRTAIQQANQHKRNSQVSERPREKGSTCCSLKHSR